MIRLIWRQHRGQILWIGLTVAGLSALAFGYGLSVNHWLQGYEAWLRQLSSAGCPPPDAHSGAYHVSSPATCAALKARYPGGLQVAFSSRYGSVIQLFQYGVPAAFAIVGALVGSPLVAREIEQRTQLAAWTQSVPRLRWYVEKAAVLGIVLLTAGLLSGAAFGWLQRQFAAGDTSGSRWPWFLSINVVPAGDVVLAFAIGVAVGALLRRTLPAIGGTMVAVLLLLVGGCWAVLALAPAQEAGPSSPVPDGSWVLRSTAGVSASFHPPTQYVVLQVFLVCALLIVSVAALAVGWWATRTRGV